MLKLLRLWKWLRRLGAWFLRLLRRMYYKVLLFFTGFLEGDRVWGLVRLGLMLSIMLLPGIFSSFRTASLAEEPTQGFLMRFAIALFSPLTLRYTAATFFALVIALVGAARYIQDIYELEDYWVAFGYLFASVFGLGYPLLQISEGKKQTKPDEVNTLEKIGGPGWLLISPGNAVLLERINHPSNVRAAGLHFVSRFEKIKEILDLTDQHWHVDKFSAISKDGLIVNIHDFQFRYRLWGIHKEGGITGRNPVNPYPYSTHAVRNMVYNRSMRASPDPDQPEPFIPSWQATVQLAVDGEVQTYIRKNMVDAIISPEPGQNPREEIRKGIMASNIRGSLRAIGAHLIWIDIGYFTVDDPAVEVQNIQTWGAKWGGEADLLRARGEAARQAVIEQARADAQADFLIKIAEALAELDANVRFGDRERLVRMFLLKIMQVMDELRRPYSLPATVTPTVVTMDPDNGSAFTLKILLPENPSDQEKKAKDTPGSAQKPDK